MLTKLEQLSTEVVAENPFWQYRKDKYTYPNGTEGDYHYVRTNGSVFVIPVTDEGKFVLVRQYRYLNRREGLEFVGGGIKTGVSAEEAARAELLEEAGITSTRLLRIGEFNPYNGVTDELCRVFAAYGLTMNEPKPDESEEFERVILDAEELEHLIACGEIWDGMTLAAFAMFRVQKSV